MNWLQVSYQPTTLFTLRPSWTTSSGGKTLLVPSPYALKMAILDVAIRTSGLPEAKQAWDWIRNLQIGVQLPAHILVTHLFAKILRQRRDPAKPGTANAGPFQHTISYREYVYYPSPLQFNFGVEKKEQLRQLGNWLWQISYLGRRGGFMQMVMPPTMIEQENAGTLSLTTPTTHIPLTGLIQQLDDCSPQMQFNQANIYDPKKPNRITHHIILPFQLTQSSKSYTLYRQIN